MKDNPSGFLFWEEKIMKNRTQQLIMAGLLLALGIILPIVFHAFSLGGPVFLPMHIPVIIAGFTLSPIFAVLVGVLTPTLSSIFTGMPPMYPILPIMVVELGVYALSISLLQSKFKLNTVLTLIIGMVLGRIAAGLTVMSMVSLVGLKMKPIMFVKGAITTGVPGLVLQLLIIPVIVIALKRAKYVKSTA